MLWRLALRLDCLAEERHRVAALHRTREVEALAALATEVAQRVPLLLELDALGHHLERQRLPEGDNRRGETGLLGRLAGAQERAVHLQHVHREAAEVRQRRVAG